MSKYDSMKVIKPTTSRRDQVCVICKEIIPAGETHIGERLTDPRINFIGKRYHFACMDECTEKDQKIEDFQRFHCPHPVGQESRENPN
jgi:hypothetical protein